MNASVHDLRVNRAQMRTRVRVAELARLAVQVKEGLDPNLALILRPRGRQGAFEVVSGHRRWLALMIAFIAQAGLNQSVPQTGEEELELMQSTIERLCPIEDGFVMLSDRLYETLTGLVPQNLSVPYHPWDGSTDEGLLLLIRANSGAEEPDLLGQARAYQAATEARVPWEQLAQVTGQPVGRLQTLVALLNLPAIFGELVNDGLMDLSVVLDLYPVPKLPLKALAEALRARVEADRERAVEESLRGYSRKVQAAAAFLMMGPPSHDSSNVEPESVNFALAVQALWVKAEVLAPEQLFQAISAWALDDNRLSGLNQAMYMLATVPVLRDHFVITETRWGRQEITLTQEAVMGLLPELNCATCAFSDLPGERLKHDLLLPCRTGKDGPCIHWTRKGKKFSLRIPYFWQGGGEAIKSFNGLKAAWEKQKEWEKRSKAAQRFISGSSKDIQEQRACIRAYMDSHTGDRFDLRHPWATPCARCVHHLEASPVKSDPDAPHCTWAKGRRRLQFRAFAPHVDGKDRPEGIIPFCMQFTPDRPWVDIIPEADTDLPFGREYALSLLRELSYSVNRNCWSTDSRGALQFLTGRPSLASAGHRQSFAGQLALEVSLLSDRQVCTLLQWMLLEWHRVQTGSSLQMAPGEEGLFEVHVLFFGQVMPGGVMEEVWVEKEEEEEVQED